MFNIFVSNIMSFLSPSCKFMHFKILTFIHKILNQKSFLFLNLCTSPTRNTVWPWTNSVNLCHDKFQAYKKNIFPITDCFLSFHVNCDTILYLAERRTNIWAFVSMYSFHIGIRTVKTWQPFRWALRRLLMNSSKLHSGFGGVRWY